MRFPFRWQPPSLLLNAAEQFRRLRIPELMVGPLASRPALNLQVLRIASAARVGRFGFLLFAA